jgi:hypothetical protein
MPLDKQLAADRPKPNFEPGTCLTARGFFVDRDGVMWWVDPERGYVKEAMRLYLKASELEVDGLLFREVQEAGRRATR